VWRGVGDDLSRRQEAAARNARCGVGAVCLMSRAFSPVLGAMAKPGALPRAGIGPRLWRSNFRR
jgi:hypothetical protein